MWCSTLTPVFLVAGQGDVEDILKRFNAFKKNVPTMGGILLDASMERVLLVKGWKSTGSWGFPRGKINQNETDMDCAVREVLEETGVDLDGEMKEEDTIEIFMDGKRNKLYIVAGVDPDSTEFAPKCRGVSRVACRGSPMSVVWQGRC